MTTSDPVSGIYHVETIADLFDEGNTLLEAWFLDDAVTPSGSETITYGSPPVTYIRFFGLWHLNGKTVTAFVGGLDCGSFQVTAGSIDVPFAPAGTNPLLTQAYLNSISGSNYGGLAANIDATITVNPPPSPPGPPTILAYVPGPAGDNTTNVQSGPILVDWANNRVITLGSDNTGTVLRTYNLATGAQTNILTPGTTDYNAGLAGVALGYDGSIYITPAGNFDELFKVNPVTLTETATFGHSAGGSGGDGSDTLGVPNSMAAIQENGVNFLAWGTTSLTGHNIGVVNTDRMTFAGHLATFLKNSPWVCRGQVQGGFGTAYTTAHDTAGINLYTTSVNSGAEQYGLAGNWEFDKLYQVNDLVLYLGYYYYCTIGPNLGFPPALGLGWKVIRLGAGQVLAWSSLTTYALNDVAVYKGIPYISLAGSNLNNIPGSSAGEIGRAHV